MATTPTTSTSVLDRAAGFFKSINPFSSTTPVTTPAANTPAAPTAQVQQPGPAPKQNVVDVALKALTTSDLQKDLDKLWEDKVTKASTLGKIFGVISYVFNLPSAYAKSLAARATIAELNDSVSDLAKAVHQRALTDNEKRVSNAPNIKVSSIEAQIGQAGANLAAEAALKKFYEVFAKRVNQLGISKDSETFGNCAEAAKKMIRNAGEVGRKALVAQNTAQNIRESQVIPVKIETTVREFTNVAVTAIIEELSGKEKLEQITPDNFKSTVKAISIIAPGQSAANVHAEIRKAIKEKHGVEFLPLIQEFSNVNADSRVNQEIRNGIKAALEADKTAEEANLAAINAQLQPIRGNDYGQGEVHAAWEAFQKAEQEYNAAESAFVTLRYVGAPANTRRRALLDLGYNPSDALVAAHKDALEKLAVLEAAEAKYNALNTTCQTLLTQRGTVEGKLGQIATNLTDGQLDIAARSTREKSLRFYQELNNVVEVFNMNTRYSAMQAIIGN